MSSTPPADSVSGLPMASSALGRSASVSFASSGQLAATPIGGSPAEQFVTGATAQLALLPGISVDDDTVSEGNGRGRQRNTGESVEAGRWSSRQRAITSFRGAAVPENKGGLPKIGHVGICYEQDIFVFGGVNSKGQYNNHVFRHEKHTLNWREFRGVGVVPRGRANHAAVLVGSKMYIFGGHRQLEVFDDLFAFEIETGRWEKIPCERSQGPGPVFLHCMVYIPPVDSLFVIGGVHQREQNSCLGHLFDVRNRVWTGVPPPASVDPQHLQLVTAAYNPASAVVVVLGMMTADVLTSSADSVPHVHIFQPASFTWRRVETTTAPESPLPFRMEDAWETLLHLLIPSGGGVYDPLSQCWMFPLPLTATDEPADSVVTRPAMVAPPMPLNKYGFFILDMGSMSWSLVPCKFPRKFMAELNAVNRTERAKMERLAQRSTAAAAAAAITGPPGRHKPAPPPRSSGILEVSRLSVSYGLGGDGSQRPSVSRSRAPPPPRQGGSSSVSGPWLHGSPNRGSSTAAQADARANARTAALFSPMQYRRLFFFDEAQEFMRKYTIVAVRDGPTRSGKLRPLLHVVVHGGLTEPNDYAMLMFAPTVTRVELPGIGGGSTGAVANAAGTGQQMSRPSSFRGRGAASLPGRRVSSYSHARDVMADDHVYGDDGTDESTSLGSAAYPAQRRFRGSALPRELDLASVNRDDSDDDESEASMSRGIDGRGEAGRRSYLLPLLQNGRSNRNYNRFALQFTASNATQKESLLPYANIPVAVFQSREDAQWWSRRYYTEQRRWISDRLKDALTEDRKLRRLRQLAKARQTSSGSAGPVRGSGSMSGCGDHDDSDGDSDSIIESLFLMESFFGRARSGSGGKSSMQLGHEDQLALEAAAAAVTEAEAPKKRARDFFEDHGLDAFDSDWELRLEEQRQAERRAMLTERSASPNGADGEEGRGDRRKKDAKAKNGAGGKTAAAKGGKKGDSSNASTSPPGTSNGVVSPESAAEVVLARPCFDRLRVKGRREGARERVVAPAAFRGAGGALGAPPELMNTAAFALLKRSVGRLREDADSIESRRRAAYFRWRYLRALVCTGEASYLLYVASQADSKMKGVVVTGTPGLLLAPELHFAGPTQAYRVPCKPVPYNVAATAAPPPASSSRFAQVTSTGMVVYHSFK